MIIVNCKNCFPHVQEKKLYYKNIYYFNSIEYIDNEYDEILIKTTNCDRIRYHNLKSQLHNPIGPAIVYYLNGKLMKFYYLNGVQHFI